MFLAAVARKCRVLIADIAIVVRAWLRSTEKAVDLVFLAFMLLLFFGMGLYVVAAGKL